MSAEIKVCPVCNREFAVSRKETNRGKGIYCSYQCRGRTQLSTKPDPMGVNAGNALENTACPFSINRLNELYWKEGKSLSQIGRLAADINERENAYSSGAVDKWFKKANIPTRSAGEASALGYKINPKRRENMSILLAYRNQTKDMGSPLLSRDHYKRAGRKGGKIRQKQCEALRVIRRCGNPDCKNTVSRKPAQAAKSEFSYCCNSCKVSHQNKLRPYKKAVKNAHESLIRQAERIFS